jgi:hypothetical protein
MEVELRKKKKKGLGGRVKHTKKKGGEREKFKKYLSGDRGKS